MACRNCMELKKRLLISEVEHNSITSLIAEVYGWEETVPIDVTETQYQVLKRLLKKDK